MTEFVKGIEIECDGVLEANTIVNKPTVFFTLDLPFPFSAADKQFWGDTVVGTAPLTLDGIVRVNENVIVWRPTDLAARWLLGRWRKLIMAGKIARSLLHLTLKGNFVYGQGEPKLNVDGEAFGILQEGGPLDAAQPSGDGRRGGTLDLWYWLRPRTATGGGRVVLVPLVRANVLTTGARRSGVGRMVSLSVDRSNLLAALPGEFTVDTRATTDPARARATVSRLRLAAAATIRVAVEETLAGAGDLIARALREHEVATQVEMMPVGNLVESFPSLAEQNIDAILASQETVDALAELHPTELDMQRTIVL